MSESSSAPRLVRACRNERLDRPPVWLMRQAGRYMAEYRAVREKVSFLDLCKNPELAAEVSLQPYKSFKTDGVIMFSDILIPPEAMGMEVVFGDGSPHFPNPIRHADDIERLIIPDPVEKTGFVMDILKRLRHELKDDPETGLIGFAGSPWTLAVYMVEGGGSRHFARIKELMYEAPDQLDKLLQKLTETVTRYLNAQIEAGAQVVQLFDTWAGILSADDYRRFVLPCHQQILGNLKRDKAPAILYVNNSRGLLPMMVEAKPDVISVDSLTSLTEARQIMGSGIALQGNLDPVLLLGNSDVLDRHVQQLLREGGNQGYIFNLGHGILPPTPPDNVRLLVNRVKESAALYWKHAQDSPFGHADHGKNDYHPSLEQEAQHHQHHHSPHVAVQNNEPQRSEEGEGRHNPAAPHQAGTTPEKSSPKEHDQPLQSQNPENKNGDRAKQHPEGEKHRHAQPSFDYILEEHLKDFVSDADYHTSSPTETRHQEPVASHPNEKEQKRPKSQKYSSPIDSMGEDPSHMPPTQTSSTSTLSHPVEGVEGVDAIERVRPRA